MMQTALRRLGAHSAEAYMVGDRKDTDILSGTEVGMRTILVRPLGRQHPRDD
jgi:NagD protein